MAVQSKKIVLGDWDAAERKFVAVEPGAFFMGSPEKEAGRRSGEDLHRVTLSKGFFMQATTVTVGQWRNFVYETGYVTDAERNGGAWRLIEKAGWRLQWILPRYDWRIVEDCYWDKPGFYQTESHPVTCVSWNDAQEFIDWLSSVHDMRFRLPTEAEWEYACRAGTDTPYSFGPKVGFHRLNSGEGLSAILKRYPILGFLHKNQRTAPSKSYSANAWGLYNMHGNVWEWCLDRDVTEGVKCRVSDDDVRDPIGWKGDGRVLKGGSWAYPTRFCRSAHRRVLPPDFSASGIGFRILYSELSMNYR